MKLEHVVIDNFRNIKHAEYDLDRINLFTGPNATGKTNTILAIYWAITDFMVDGSSDYASFKPHDDPKAEVSVELTFDTFTLKKTFAEKWVKTRGSSESIMSGHVTTYWIDGVKLKITDAKKELAERLGVSSIDTGAFDLVRGIMDPYYFGRTCDWKTLRAFIIELCGDVSNDDIFQQNPELLPIKERLETDKYDTGRSTKYFKQELKHAKDGITETQGMIKGLQEIKDPSAEDVQHAEAEIERLNKNIKDLKAGNGTSSIIDELNAQLHDAQVDLREKQAADRENAMQQNAAVNDAITSKNAEINASVQKEADILKEELSPLESQLANLRAEINRNEDIKERRSADRDRLYRQYDKLDAWTAPEGMKCPNCGYVLNQDYVDDQVHQHDEDMQRCIADGQRASADIENATMKLADLHEKVRSIEIKRDTGTDHYEAQKKHTKLLQSELAELRRKIVPASESMATREAAEAVQAIKEKLKQSYIKETDDESALHDAVAEIEKQKIQYQEVIDAHGGYRLAQAKITDLEKQEKAGQRQQIDIEQKLILIENFVQTKLQMFSDRISSVFGSRMKFQLIQENIKEGSWSEVCVPKIVDKETPYLDGSGSEQIITGIYFAECVKKKLGLPDLPYIFDECDKLDGSHLAAIDTQAQIISTIVNDRDYSTVTLVKRG